jgi:hypothetical protein
MTVEGRQPASQSNANGLASLRSFFGSPALRLHSLGWLAFFLLAAQAVLTSPRLMESGRGPVSAQARHFLPRFAQASCHLLSRHELSRCLANQVPRKGDSGWVQGCRAIIHMSRFRAAALPSHHLKCAHWGPVLYLALYLGSIPNHNTTFKHN